MTAKVLCTNPVIEIDGVRYRHHVNGGGMVAETAQVDKSVFIDYMVLVRDRAEIRDNVQISGLVDISGDVIICGNVQIRGVVNIGRRAIIAGNAKIDGHSSLITDDVVIWGNISVKGRFILCGENWYGDSYIIKDGQMIKTRIDEDASPTVRFPFHNLSRGSELHGEDSIVEPDRQTRGGVEVSFRRRPTPLIKS